MNRAGFLKTLVGIVVAPKVIAEVAAKTTPVSVMKGNALLINQLQLLTPMYYKRYVEKYGSEDFTFWLAANETVPCRAGEFVHFEKAK